MVSIAAAWRRMLVTVTVIGLVFTARVAFACQCVELSLASEIAGTDVIFEGDVQGFREVREPGMAAVERVALARVVRGWKGASPGATVEIHPGARLCGFPIAARGRYLVFAGQASDGTIVTTSCTRTRLSSKATADIAELALLTAAPLPSPATTDASSPPEPDAGTPPPISMSTVPKASGCAGCSQSGSPFDAFGALAVVACLIFARRRRQLRPRLALGLASALRPPYALIGTISGAARARVGARRQHNLPRVPACAATNMRT